MLILKIWVCGIVPGFCKSGHILASGMDTHIHTHTHMHTNIVNNSIFKKPGVQAEYIMDLV